MVTPRLLPDTRGRAVPRPRRQRRLAADDPHRRRVVRRHRQPGAGARGRARWWGAFTAPSRAWTTTSPSGAGARTTPPDTCERLREALAAHAGHRLYRRRCAPLGRAPARARRRAAARCRRWPSGSATAISSSTTSCSPARARRRRAALPHRPRHRRAGSCWRSSWATPGAPGATATARTSPRRRFDLRDPGRVAGRLPRRARARRWASRERPGAAAGSGVGQPGAGRPLRRRRPRARATSAGTRRASPAAATTTSCARRGSGRCTRRWWPPGRSGRTFWSSMADAPPPPGLIVLVLLAACLAAPARAEQPELVQGAGGDRGRRPDPVCPHRAGRAGGAGAGRAGAGAGGEGGGAAGRPAGLPAGGAGLRARGDLADRRRGRHGAAGPGRWLAWELEIPLWNLEGHLWLWPRADGATLELTSGDLAPGRFR